MTKIIRLAGDLVAVMGVAVCLIALASRLARVWLLAGIQISALFELGTGLMVMGCLSKLYQISSKDQH